jgi:hypothetical protein
VVTPLILLGSFVLVLTAGHLILVPRSIRRMRAVREEGREFRRRWRALAPARRRELMRAVRRGQPLTDPQEAELALEAIRNDERIAAALRPLQLMYAPAIAGIVVFGLVEHEHFLIVVAAAIVALLAVSRLLLWQRARKLRQTAAALRARARGGEL